MSFNNQLKLRPRNWQTGEQGVDPEKPMIHHYFAVGRANFHITEKEVPRRL